MWAASEEEDGNRVDLVMDGQILTRVEQVMKPPLFRGTGRDLEVQWAVRRGNSVRRVIASGFGVPPSPTAGAPAPNESQGGSLDSTRPPV